MDYTDEKTLAKTNREKMNTVHQRANESLTFENRVYYRVICHTNSEIQALTNY